MNTRDIHEGMKVHASDGGNLGKVVMMNEENFIIEKGFFFPKEYTASYDQIDDIRDDEIWLRESGTELREGAAAAGTTDIDERERGAETRGIRGTREEVTVPLAEEELEATAREHEVGEVRVRKDVVTEERQIDVPVRREEVHVERVPASGEAAEASFEQGETRIPIHEEEIEVRKRPVVREEVRVGKTAHEETEEVRAKVRKETAEIEEDTPRREHHPNR